MKKIPLFGTGVLGKSRTVTVQRRVNCYYEIRQDGDKQNIVVYGTPGTSVEITLSGSPNGPIRGAHNGENYLYVVAGDSLYKIPADGTAQIVTTGAFDTRVGFVDMDDNGSQLMIVDGSKGYIHTNFDTSGGTLTEITDDAFPRGCRTVTFLGGFFVVEVPNSGQFQVSAAYDGIEWDGLDFATAEQYPDTLKRVFAHSGYVIMLGEDSTEFWTNIGAADFPFAPVIPATSKYGLAAISSVIEVGESVMFLAKTRQGKYQFVMVSQYTMKVISTNDIEYIINHFNTVEDAVALTYNVDGHYMYQVSFPTARRSFLYDASTEMWSEVQTGVSPNRHLGQLSVLWQGQSLVSDYRSSKPLFYKMDDSVYTDNGETIKRIIQTRHVFEEGNVIGVDELFLDMETGVGLQSGQGKTPQIMLQTSKDGGRIFGSERWTTIGKIGQYEGPRAVWRRFGAGRDFTWRIEMTDPVKFVITYGAIVPRYKTQ